MRWEFHLISGPAIGHEWCRQPAMLRQDVCGEIAPDMIAAEMLFLFDQHDFEFGPHPRNRERNQPAGETAADYRQIAFDIFQRGGRHERGTSRTVS